MSNNNNNNNNNNKHHNQNGNNGNNNGQDMKKMGQQNPMNQKQGSNMPQQGKGQQHGGTTHEWMEGRAQHPAHDTIDPTRNGRSWGCSRLSQRHKTPHFSSGGYQW